MVYCGPSGTRLGSRICTTCSTSGVAISYFDEWRAIDCAINTRLGRAS